jgi:hypothetical protein
VTQRPLSVDPDGVIQTGGAYTDTAQVVRAYLQQLHDLRSAYHDCWGNDDLGKQFSEKFLEGLDALEAVVNGVAESLDFSGEGLTSGGKAYQGAEEDATDASNQLHQAMSTLNPQSQYQAPRCQEQQEPPPQERRLVAQQEEKRAPLAPSANEPKLRPNGPVGVMTSAFAVRPQWQTPRWTAIRSPTDTC